MAARRGRPSTVVSVLRAELQQYRGGLAGLSKDSGVPLPTIYRITGTRMRRAPLATLQALANAIASNKSDVGRARILVRLAALWARDSEPESPAQ